MRIHELSATKASFSSVEKRRLRATPVITSTFENVSDIGTCLGLSLGPPAKAGVRSKRGAVRMQPGMSVSYVARCHGLSPSLVFRWRRLMSEGGKEAVRADDEVVAASEVRRLEERVRELERLLGRKTMEVEMLKALP